MLGKAWFVSHSSAYRYNGVQINKGHICNQLPENQLQKSNLAEEYKLEIATELIKEGLTVEQIARVLKLPLELVKEQLEKPKQPN